MCACAPPAGWSMLLRAVSFPSRAQWCHIRFLWASPAGWLCYYKLSIFMVVVEFCLWLGLYLFPDFTQCHILLGTRPWFCICGGFQWIKTYLGALAMAGPGGILRLSLKYVNIGWSSIRYWLSIDWLLVIDQWSLTRYWLSIGPLLVIDQSSIPFLPLAHRHTPASHTCSHTPHTFSKSY